jgi:hypothetical protein
MLSLKRPTFKHKATLLNALREYHTEGHSVCGDIGTVAEYFPALVRLLHSRSTEPPPGRVPETGYLLIRCDEYNDVSVAYGSGTNGGVMGNTENVDRNRTSAHKRRHRVDV